MDKIIFAVIGLLTVDVIALQILGYRLLKNSAGQLLFRRFVSLALAVTLILIALLEIRIRFNGGSHPDVFLFSHIVFGICFLSTLSLLYFKSKSTPAIHFWMLGVNFISFVATVGLGIKLLSRL